MTFVNIFTTKLTSRASLLRFIRTRSQSVDPRAEEAHGEW